MTPQPSDRGALDLAGFALSHALWSIADGDGNLCTLAVVEAPPGGPHVSVEGLAASIYLPAARYAEGMRTLLRFPADTIPESIDTARALLVASTEEIARSALVWDGYVTYEGNRLDALFVEVMSRGTVQFVLAERYQPRTAQARFSTLGNPLLIGEGQITPLAGEQRAWLMAGMKQHRLACRRRDIPTLEDEHRPAA